MPFVVQEWNGHDYDDREDSIAACFSTMKEAVEWCSVQEPRSMYKTLIPILEAFTIFEMVGAECLGEYFADGQKKNF